MSMSQPSTSSTSSTSSAPSEPITIKEQIKNVEQTTGNKLTEADMRAANLVQDFFESIAEAFPASNFARDPMRTLFPSLAGGRKFRKSRKHKKRKSRKSKKRKSFRRKSRRR